MIAAIDALASVINAIAGQYLTALSLLVTAAMTAVVVMSLKERDHYKRLFDTATGLYADMVECVEKMRRDE